MHKSVRTALVLTFAAACTTTDVDGGYSDSSVPVDPYVQRLRNSNDYLGFAVFENGEIVGFVDGDGNTTEALGGECYGERLCCDVVTLGCFCAPDSEHNAVCPSGSVAAPETTGSQVDAGDED